MVNAHYGALHYPVNPDCEHRCTVLRRAVRGELAETNFVAAQPPRAVPARSTA